MLQDSSLSAPIYEKFIHILALFFLTMHQKIVKRLRIPVEFLNMQ